RRRYPCVHGPRRPELGAARGVRAGAHGGARGRVPGRGRHGGRGGPRAAPRCLRGLAGGADWSRWESPGLLSFPSKQRRCGATKRKVYGM
ncbi:unnamed protein product, partial [Heterosigma akashiwo]